MISDSKIQTLPHQAVAHHQAGQLGSAESLYARVIKAQPRNADAQHLLSVIAHGRNEIAKAKYYFDGALKDAPSVHDIHLNFVNLPAADRGLAGRAARLYAGNHTEACIVRRSSRVGRCAL